MSSPVLAGAWSALDAAHVEASFTSERHVRVDGLPVGPPFPELSTWLRTSDGWLRSHANYPRERAAWEAHPQGRALAGRGPFDLDRGRPRASPLPGLETGALPAAGVRVLDLTRVIAGPGAGRTLAALGAGVLRIDAPGAIELELQAIDTGPGKRSAHLDLRTRAGASALDALLADADVVIEGYRPGALDGVDTAFTALGDPDVHAKILIDARSTATEPATRN